MPPRARSAEVVGWAKRLQAGILLRLLSHTEVLIP
jgi:hypothetical protein